MKTERVREILKPRISGNGDLAKGFNRVSLAKELKVKKWTIYDALSSLKKEGYLIPPSTPVNDNGSAEKPTLHKLATANRIAKRKYTKRNGSYVQLLSKSIDLVPKADPNISLNITGSPAAIANFFRTFGR